MSFRLRLTLFFVLIVVAADGRAGGARHRRSPRTRPTARPTPGSTPGCGRRRTSSTTPRADSRPGRQRARAGDRPTIRRRLTAIARATRRRPRPRPDLRPTRRDRVRRRSSIRPVARRSPATRARSPTADGRPRRRGRASRSGRSRSSTTSRDAYLREVEAATGEQAALVGPAGPVDRRGRRSRPGRCPRAARRRTSSAAASELRVAATEPLGDEQVRVALLRTGGRRGLPRLAAEGRDRAARRSSRVALIAVGLHPALAAGLRPRDARRGAADRRGRLLRSEVPVSGNDEMAGLASEFNKMSDRLSDQMDQLRRQRVEIEKSVRRIGEAFASGPRPPGAARDPGRDRGRRPARPTTGWSRSAATSAPRPRPGRPTDAIQEAALAAEQRALREAGPVEVVARTALTRSRARSGGSARPATPVGAMTIARAGQAVQRRASARSSCICVGQAAASVENVALHELVSEQAVTDDLTGLANKRAFRERDGQGGGARGALRPRPLAADPRHRRLQAGQRHLRPPRRATRCCGRSAGSSPTSRAGSTSRRATAARSSSSRCPRPSSRARSRSPSGSASGSRPSGAAGRRRRRRSGSRRASGVATLPAAAVDVRRADRRGRRGALRGQARAARTGSSSRRRARTGRRIAGDGPADSGEGTEPLRGESRLAPRDRAARRLSADPTRSSLRDTA